MSGAARLTDLALQPGHCHGCPTGVHVVVGPTVTASGTVLINGLGALRLMDMGVHAACCGPNVYVTAMGSSKVFVENLAVVRLGDVTAHCGAYPGAMITASANVIVPA